MDYKAVREALFGRPIVGPNGQFQVGGPLGGHAGQLDTLYEMAPGTGDYRALVRALQAGKPRLTPDGLGGAKVGVDQNTLLGEAMTLAPAIGDVASIAKAGAAGLAPLAAMMARKTKRVPGIMRNQAGIIGYHGSPHKFTKFDHSKMGTGEGAQAYGWGTYIAENPEVAKNYLRSDFSVGDGGGFVPRNYEITQIINRSEGDTAKLKKDLLDYISRPGNQESPWSHIEDAQKIVDSIDEGKFKLAGDMSMYEVDLPDEHIAKMLDWDAPLSEQPENVKQAIKSNMPEHVRGAYTWDEIKDWSGQDYYSRQTLKQGQSDQLVSENLNRLGIPGIKYFDGNSRTAGEGTRNFVVFDEDLMTILKRNDEKI